MSASLRLSTALLVSQLSDIVTLTPGRGNALLAADTVREHLTGHRVMRWLAPDTATANQLGTDLTLLIEHLLEHGGVVDMFDDRSALAVWTPAVDDQGPLPPLATLRRSSVDPVYAERCAALEAILRTSAPARDGHLLLVMATKTDVVSPVRVWTLLHRHHQDLDTERLTGHAVALDPATRWLMHRHGYTSGRPGGRLPNGTPWWPLRREPLTTHPTRGA
ncbi:hypothetical protein ACQP2P_16440 [Dactylosporangium sp. CA-139114]|uniref:hypothetical protein n=1 Tax=Dactylosporangium sp. CA-139114 TaxID=3239931 RepID=UPI003D9919BC